MKKVKLSSLKEGALFAYTKDGDLYIRGHYIRKCKKYYVEHSLFPNVYSLESGLIYVYY